MTDWEESQSYLAFMASSYSFNSEDKEIAYRLLEKHDQGKTWSSAEIEKMKLLLNRRRNQVGAWEREMNISSKNSQRTSYREFEA